MSGSASRGGRAAQTQSQRRAHTVVAVDANGADMGPSEVAAGARLAAEHGVHSLLFGPAAELGEPGPGVEVVDAPVSLAKSPDPVRAVRSTPVASIVQAARAVGEGRAQTLVCAGGTGAALAAGLFNIKRAPGIHRPALALPIPIPGGSQPAHAVTLLDVGANVQARPEHLVQFAFMGAAFAKAVLGVERPRVGLLSNGEEAQRGSEPVVRAGAELARRSAQDAMRFVGNVEGADIVGGVADVIVCDGFTGNIALKLMEGVSQTMLGAIRQAALGSARGKLGGMLLRPSLRAFRDEIDPEEAGGAYLLGLRRLAVVPHGRFARRGFAQAILRAERGVREQVVQATHAALRDAGALKSAPVSGNPASLSSE
ncbi:MAG TPA: phosphate acyltransferase PlsX [Solirubrobacteraceae bacterium]|jgi:glycerol-3-phosphate acyltransferase PlsX|nr:phosphate acyltransferase PlsX [Solirubrobacteraceae bacterium]